MTDINKKPFFSIIVPVYKTQQYLDECFLSLINQSFTDFEVIAVDDGSPDDSGKMLDMFKEKDCRVKVIHKENGGLVSARKAGLSESLGEYILNVDSDDYIDQTLLEKLYEVINKHNSPDIISFDYIYFDENEKETVKVLYDYGLYQGQKLKTVTDYIIYDCNLKSINSSGMSYGTCLKAIKREMLFDAQMSVPNDISMGEDLSVTANVLTRCSSLYILDFAGYYYRRNRDSMVHSFNPQGIMDIEKVCMYLSSILDKKYESNINVYALRCTRHYIKRGLEFFENKKDFVSCLNENIKKDIMKRIIRAKVYKSSPKERIYIAIVKLRLWAVLWKIYK